MTIFLKEFVVPRCLWRLHWTTPGNFDLISMHIIFNSWVYWMVWLKCEGIFSWLRFFLSTSFDLHENSLERIDIILCLYAELAFGKLQNGWPRYEIKRALDVLLQSYCRQTWVVGILVKVVVLDNARKQLMNMLFWWKFSGNLELKCSFWISMMEGWSRAIVLMTERLAGKRSSTISLH